MQRESGTAIAELLEVGAACVARKGRPPKTITQESRELVLKASALGMPHKEIALIMRMDLKTLKKHYDNELRRGRFLAIEKVAGVAFELASSGNDSPMTRWWLEVIGGMRKPADSAVQVNLDNRQININEIIKGGL